MDLFSDFKKEIETDLQALGIAYDSNARLEEVLVLRYTHMRKTIRPLPRTVHQSNEFRSALARCPAGEQSAMNDILGKFQHGDDVNEHLSRESINPRKADGMLYDWDVYHLHVSNTKRNPAQKFFDRNGPVALVRVAQAEAYFIDIRSHGASNPLLWTQKDILEIIDRNWPTLLDPFACGLRAAHNPSASELKKLRGDAHTGKGAVVPLLQIGNRVIAVPGGGMATDGTANSVMERVDYSLYLIKDLEEFLRQHGESIKVEIEPKINVPAARQDFKLSRTGRYWVIFESISGKPLAIRELESKLANLPAAA